MVEPQNNPANLEDAAFLSDMSEWDVMPEDGDDASEDGDDASEDGDDANEGKDRVDTYCYETQKPFHVNCFHAMYHPNMMSQDIQDQMEWLKTNSAHTVSRVSKRLLSPKEVELPAKKVPTTDETNQGNGSLLEDDGN